MLNIVRRTAATLPLAVLAVGAGAALSSAAAAWDHEGRESQSHTVDGSYSELEGNGFSANVGQCVLYSALSADWTVEHLVQAGVLRCNSENLDSTACPGGTAFVEINNSSGYHCTAGYSIANNTLYDATTYRTSATATTFYGHVNGASNTVGGMDLTDDIRAYAWGEASGWNSVCPAPSKGTFTLWKRYDSVGGWLFVTSSSRYSHTAMDADCWPNISDVTSGEFSVD